MTLTYIRWRDAQYSGDETAIEEIGPVELDACGFIVKETEDAVTVGVEYPGAKKTARHWLCIPQQNIVERRDMELSKAFPVKKSRNGKGR